MPDCQGCMLPLLKLATDGQEHFMPNAVESVAKQLNLTAEERQQRLASGAQLTLDNRVGWARTYLTKAGLPQKTKRSFFQITDRGRI